MTTAEAEVIADAGLRLKRIAELLTVPGSMVLRELSPSALVGAMDDAALSISEVYGQLSALPIEVEGDAGA